MDINWRGTYDSTQDYVKLDAIIYSNKFFLCITDHTSASPQQPNPSGDTSFWALYGSDSNFPTLIDNFITRVEISPSDITNINTYQSLLLKENKTPTEIDQMNSLANQYRNKLLLSSDINLLQSSIQNLEMFFKSDVDGYINTMQNTLQTEINRFTYIGIWSSATQYYTWNMVTYNSQVYIAKQNSLNIAPTTGDSNDSYWLLLSKQGDTGPQGAPGINLSYAGIWSSSSSYTTNQLVTYNSSAYACIQDTSPGTDPSNNTYWSIFMSNAPIPVSSTAPVSPNIGALWVDTSV